MFDPETTAFRHTIRVYPDSSVIGNHMSYIVYPDNDIHRYDSSDNMWKPIGKISAAHRSMLVSLARRHGTAISS